MKGFTSKVVILGVPGAMALTAYGTASAGKHFLGLTNVMNSTNNSCNHAVVGSAVADKAIVDGGRRGWERCLGGEQYVLSYPGKQRQPQQGGVCGFHRHADPRMRRRARKPRVCPWVAQIGERVMA